MIQKNNFVLDLVLVEKIHVKAIGMIQCFIQQDGSEEHGPSGIYSLRLWICPPEEAVIYLLGGLGGRRPPEISTRPP